MSMNKDFLTNLNGFNQVGVLMAFVVEGVCGTSPSCGVSRCPVEGPITVSSCEVVEGSASRGVV